MNLEIREFEEEIIKKINNSMLPIEVIRLALNEIILKVNSEADRIIALEKADRIKKNTEQRKEQGEGDE